VLPEFSARVVAMQVIEHLERRRPAIAGDPEAIKTEVDHALAPVRKAYADVELPRSYLDALATEMTETLPARWRALAEPFTRLEQRGFGLWRGGDVPARLAFVLAGLILGGLIVAAPFIPIWEKWFPFVLAVAAWWLPDLQVRWHKRRYARDLGALVATLDRAQPALDQHVTITELLPPPEDKHE